MDSFSSRATGRRCIVFGGLLGRYDLEQDLDGAVEAVHSGQPDAAVDERHVEGEPDGEVHGSVDVGDFGLLDQRRQHHENRGTENEDGQHAGASDRSRSVWLERVEQVFQLAS